MAGSFNPQDITLLRNVLDEVWADIEPQTPSTRKAEVREEIGQELVKQASDGERDQEKLKSLAMAMALSLLTQSHSN
jgi:hypothetical protein